MADVLAVEYLHAAVLSRFVAEQTLADTPEETARRMPFGWREQFRQGPAPRVVWTPGGAAGEIGQVRPPRYPGRSPARPLWTVAEQVTLWIVGADPTSPEDEMAQYRATRLLLDDVLRAVYLEAHTGARAVSVRWVTQRAERRYGAGIELVMEVDAMVPDAALGAVDEAVAGVGTGAMAETEDVPVLVIGDPYEPPPPPSEP